MTRHPALLQLARRCPCHTDAGNDRHARRRPTFDEVIVGVDDYEGGRRALALAGALAASGAQITLVYVEVVQTASDPQLDAESVTERQRFGLNRLRKLRDASQIGAAVARTQAPSISRGLHEFADNRGADLLVIGASTRNAVARSQLGDDVREVLAPPPCAVAITPRKYPERAGQLRRIGLGYDGSPSSERALAVARQLADVHHAALLVYEAVASPPRPAVRWSIDDDEREERLDEELERLAALGGVEAHAQIAHEPAKAIAQFGASVDLLVLGSPSTRRPGPVSHPSTSQRVADRAVSPLLVVAADRVETVRSDERLRAATASR